MRRADRWLVVGLVAILGCAEGAPQKTDGAAMAQAVVDTLPEPPSRLAIVAPSYDLDAVRTAMTTAMGASRLPALARPGLPSARAQLTAVYGDAVAPAWVDAAARPSPAARQALAALADAASDGLRPMDYGVARLDSMAGVLDTAQKADPAMIARFDVELTAGILRFAADLHVGRISPRSVGFALRQPADLHDIPAVVASAVVDGRVPAMLASLRPPLPQYGALRTALARYRSLADSASEVVPLPKDPLHPGEAWEGAPALRRLLVRLGDLPQGAVPDSLRYDSLLAGGVARFQDRHGLTPDSVLGRATGAALRVPLGERRHQLELALERFRWLPDLGGRFILVNIPTFQLWAWDAVSDTAAPALRMGVVVGKALRTMTPVLQEELTYLIFRPYWNVPRSIAVEEVLPDIRRDPAYLARNQMELVAGPGDDAVALAATPANIARLARGELRVRQRPGPQNALGLVKFIFPNDRSVYMHDTPATALFGRARRDFSHGCVRLERPVDLATWVLAGNAGWDRAHILEAMEGADSRIVTLPRPIPVVLFYSTAIAESDGVVRFAADIYGHDARLRRALGHQETRSQRSN